MKNKCALLIGALAIISALLIIPNYNVSADSQLTPTQQGYIDKMNTFLPNGFTWQNAPQSWYWSSTGTITNNSYPASAHSWCNWGYVGNITYEGSYSVTSVMPSESIETIYITSNNGTYTGVLDFHNIAVARNYAWISFTVNSSGGVSVRNAGDSFSNYNLHFETSGSLDSVLSYFSTKVRNVNVLLDGHILTWVDGDPPMQYGIMNTNKGLKVNGADFSFYTSYTDNKFTIAYNYSLTNRDNSDSTLRIEAGDLLTFELYAKVPTKEFVEHYVSENGLGDATPSIIIDVARSLKNTTNIINTPSIPTTTIYGLNYYGYNEDDVVVYDDAYYNYQYGNDQNGILTFRVTSSNNSSDSPNLLARLVSYYGSERLAILGSALGYIDYCRSYVINIANNEWNVYNPYYTYFFQVKDDSGRNVIRANSFEGTPQQFTTNEVDDREDVGDFTIPANNTTDIQSSYTGGITNSYNNTYNNYYNTTQANQELLDYLYRYRDGGQQEDIQNAYGYLNSTIDSVSNVPVVIGKLFYGFFPPQVILLFNAMFIIFAVFIIIKIIRHLFL